MNVKKRSGRWSGALKRWLVNRHDPKKLDRKGFTIVEALIAMGVLSIMAIGILKVVNSVMKSSVSASDRVKKTSIAQARMEEHKAQLYGAYVPNMAFPVLRPALTGPVPAGTLTPLPIDFTGTTLTYGAQRQLLIDGTTDAVTFVEGYWVATPTPNPTPCQYHGDVSGFGELAWGSPVTRPPCDTTRGLIKFDVNTPPNVNGNLVFTFTDFQAKKRCQSVWVDGVLLKTYTGDSTEEADRLSTDAANPTTLSYPFNRYDTEDGLLQVEIHQEGAPNEWGGLVEDGTNQRGFEIIGCNLTPIGTPTRTPTRTATPGSTVCSPYTGNWIEAENFNRNDFDLGGGGTDQYMYPRQDDASTWADSPIINVSCSGLYEVEGVVRVPSNAPGNNYDFTRNSIDVQIIGATPVFGPTPIARWEEMNYNSWQTLKASHRGNSLFDSQPQYDPAYWWIDAGMPVTVRFLKAEADRWLRIRRIRLNLAAVATPTPTGTGTAMPTATFTLTPTPGGCSFPGTPVLVSVLPDPTWVSGMPTYTIGMGCKSNDINMAVTGITGTGKVHVRSGPISIEGPDMTPTPGYPVERTGTLRTYLRLPANMSVTMRAYVKHPTPVVTAVSTYFVASTTGWYDIGSPSLPPNTRINQIQYDFAGASTSLVTYLLIDSVRLAYDTVDNPNAVMNTASIDVMDSLLDYQTYAPHYIVESQIEPGTGAGASKGYVVRVRVYNGKNYLMVTPTPGPSVNQATPVPHMDIDARFPPVEISNSISP